MRGSPPPPKRRPGRPRAGTPALSRERIVEVASELLEREGLDALSMRRLARALGVDPMSLYHHVPTKDALLGSVAAAHFARLDDVPVLRGRRTWRGRLRALAGAYLELAAAAPELVRALAAVEGAAEDATTRFRALFREATAELELPSRRSDVAADLVVDFVHGFALAPGARPGPAFEAELEILASGLQVEAERARARGR